jgi:hypothetical protein
MYRRGLGGRLLPRTIPAMGSRGANLETFYRFRCWRSQASLARDLDVPVVAASRAANGGATGRTRAFRC